MRTSSLLYPLMILKLSVAIANVEGKGLPNTRGKADSLGSPVDPSVVLSPIWY